MRLSQNDIDIIKKSILGLDAEAKIYLYGSRANEQLKGGDIDLLVVSEKLEFKDKLTALVDIKMALGDQKIDLSIKTPSEVSHDLFFQNVIITARLL